MKIELGKKYLTRNGLTVHIIEYNSKNKQPFKGHVLVGAGKAVFKYSIKGEFIAGIESQLDCVKEYE
jgi:hypothetical protein